MRKWQRWLDPQGHAERDQPQRPRNVGDGCDLAGELPSRGLEAPEELEGADEERRPMITPMTPSQPGTASLWTRAAPVRIVQAPVSA
jgi:hypothetical protein